MSPEIEKVARAICQAEKMNPDDALGGWVHWVDAANAAIAAVRGTLTYDHPYNDGYTHEAMHTASVLMDAWDSHVIQTRCADQFPDVKAAADAAMEAMWRTYNAAALKMED